MPQIFAISATCGESESAVFCFGFFSSANKILYKFFLFASKAFFLDRIGFFCFLLFSDQESSDLKLDPIFLAIFRNTGFALTMDAVFVVASRSCFVIFGKRFALFALGTNLSILGHALNGTDVSD